LLDNTCSTETIVPSKNQATESRSSFKIDNKPPHLRDKNAHIELYACYSWRKVKN